ncbi:MAG: hypothetical protein II970_06190 [Paludibacteraceae bacterium]|nr:hypothetical protein [Paludibacteraceae bacterium]
MAANEKVAANNNDKWKAVTANGNRGKKDESHRQKTKKKQKHASKFAQIRKKHYLCAPFCGQGCP